MMMSLFKDSVTAQGFNGVVLGLTSLFSGVLIRPNEIPSFWIFGKSSLVSSRLVS